MNKNVLGASKPSESFKITRRTHIKQQKLAGTFYFRPLTSLFSREVYFKGVKRGTKGAIFFLEKKYLQSGQSPAPQTLPICSTLAYYTLVNL